MKSILILTIGILSLVGLTACVNQSPNKGEVSVLKDGVPWEVRIYSDKVDDKFNVTLSEEIPDCIFAQLDILDIPAEEGTYSLVYNPFAASGNQPTARYYTLDCDVLLKRYDTKDSTIFENYIEVTHVTRNCIAGRFQVMLNFVGNENDTIKFTEGVFDTRTIR